MIGRKAEALFSIRTDTQSGLRDHSGTRYCVGKQHWSYRW